MRPQWYDRCGLADDGYPYDQSRVLLLFIGFLQLSLWGQQAGEKRAQLSKFLQKQDREMMAQYDKKDRSDLIKGAADASRQIMAQRLRPGSRFDNALLQRSSLGRCYIADSGVKRETSERAKRTELLAINIIITDVLGLAAIADHLELHAKSLPDA